eukprot:Blabericola_migrator_1__11727@NODE_709_length_6776_cov_105_801908_g514_i0_p4_GENE_NODE_709_length_6776_cov_105_801908_g514_i0NODE_709_length_6776_cov_105_801908_g514_i0_p4_ORF_typecomplete_len362_score69_29_NODE_709_length_6776_cov_105_801908_g514_i037924877
MLTLLTICLPFINAAERYRIAQLSRKFRRLIYSFQWEREAMIEYLYKLPLGGLRDTLSHRPFVIKSEAAELESIRLDRMARSIRTWHLACARVAAKKYGLKIQCRLGRSRGDDYICERLYKLCVLEGPLGDRTPIKKSSVQTEEEAWLSIYALWFCYLIDLVNKNPLALLGILRLRHQGNRAIPTPIEVERWWCGKDHVLGYTAANGMLALADLPELISSRELFSWKTISTPCEVVKPEIDDDGDVVIIDDTSSSVQRLVTVMSETWVRDVVKTELKALVREAGFRPFIDSVDGCDESGGGGVLVGLKHNRHEKCVWLFGGNRCKLVLPGCREIASTSTEVTRTYQDTWYGSGCWGGISRT